MDVKKVFKKNEEWVKAKLGIDTHYFENLAKGQSPFALYIGCSDSRVSPELFLSLNPGDIFVHRNIANQVRSADGSLRAVCQFALEALKVEHIIICGHYGCGGIEAAVNNQEVGSDIANWIDPIKQLYKLHADSLSDISDKEARLQKMVDISVHEQAKRMKEISLEMNVTQKLNIHEWVFDIHTGNIIDLQETSK